MHSNTTLKLLCFSYTIIAGCWAVSSSHNGVEMHDTTVEAGSHISSSNYDPKVIGEGIESAGGLHFKDLLPTAPVFDDILSRWARQFSLHKLWAALWKEDVALRDTSKFLLLFVLLGLPICIATVVVGIPLCRLSRSKGQREVFPMSVGSVIIGVAVGLLYRNAAVLWISDGYVRMIRSINFLSR